MNSSLKKSIALHLLVFLIIWIDLPLFWNNKRMSLDQVPIIVDLKDIKISEVTNLPPKAVIADEDREASAKKVKEENFAKDDPKDEPEQKQDVKEDKEEPKPEDTPEPPKDKKDYLVAPQPDKPKKAIKKEIKKIPVQNRKPKRPEPKKAPPKKEEPKLANPLKSLLASVDQMEKNIKTADQTAAVKAGTEVNNMGVEGGTKGSYMKDLSISEIDAIAGRLRACWNLDPGAQGIEDMIIEIRAHLNQDGSVRKVDILNSSRYNSDNHFRSVADSARRAVFICAPYQILSEKYADKYDLWNTMLLRFNPLNKQVN